VSGALIEQRDRLEARLYNGWDRIAVAEAAGREVRSWESLWVAVLDEYTSVCRQINVHALRDIAPAATPAAPIGHRARSYREE